jgi:hypothetical protein
VDNSKGDGAGGGEMSITGCGEERFLVLSPMVM